MRKLGEQWVEEIDWYRHLVKLSKSNIKEIGTCGGCIHHSWYEGDWCDVAPAKPCGEVGYIIKDLGILNDDGLLPCPFCGEYPSTNVEGVAYCNSCGYDIDLDDWNRRA